VAGPVVEPEPAAEPVSASAEGEVLPAGRAKPKPGVVAGLIGLATLALAGIVGAGVGIWQAVSLPKPQGLNRYLCPDSTVLHYRHGLETMVLVTPKGSFEGLLRSGRITWGNPADVARTLGTDPPDALKFDDGRRIRISGGGYGDVDCVLQDTGARQK
jgi:hypothetical protein